MVGFTVFRAALDQAIGVDFLSLDGLVRDVSKPLGAQQLKNVVTVHKLEIDDAVLRDDTRLSSRRTSDRDRKRFAAMRALKPQLEALDYRARAPTPSVYCYSQTDVVESCPGRLRGGRCATVQAPESRASIGVLLHRFPATHRWRYCTVSQK